MDSGEVSGSSSPFRYKHSVGGVHTGGFPPCRASGLQKLHAEGYEHSHRLSERSEPSQAEVSSARVARLKFQPFSLEIDVPNVKSSSP